MHELLAHVIIDPSVCTDMFANAQTLITGPVDRSLKQKPPLVAGAKACIRAERPKG